MINSEELSNFQQEIVNLLPNKSYVIQGGPGTGKTVIAVNRAKELIANDSNIKILILVYNKPLQMYIHSVIKEMGIEAQCEAKTYFQWIYSAYKKNHGQDVPFKNNNNYDYDFDKIKEDVLSGNLFALKENMYDQIIIDESQDFPPSLLELTKITAKHVTCFIDSNQSIKNDKTSLTTALLSIDVETARTLDTNYRNTQQMADLAKLYWNGQGVYPSSKKNGKKPTMVKCNTEEERTAKIAEIAGEYKSSNKNCSIGIFVNTEEEMKTMAQALGEELGSKYIQCWEKNKEDKFDFSKTGVKIFTFGTIKGLDFDAVIIGNKIKNSRANTQSADMNTIYMTLTRAAKDIYICYTDSEIESGYIEFISKIKENENLCEWI